MRKRLVEEIRRGKRKVSLLRKKVGGKWPHHKLAQ